jgi:arsenate reductase (glutaredoxin)
MSEITRGKDGRPAVTIYHNPNCGTSRNTLVMIREAGFEPEVIEYLKTPPGRTRLLKLIRAMAITPRELLRQKGTPYDELGLGDPKLGDDALIDAMVQHPILMNRPVVVTAKGTRLCRPAELVLELLPSSDVGDVAQEDGDNVSSRRRRRRTAKA